MHGVAVVATQLVGLLQRKSFLRESAAAAIVELLQGLTAQQMEQVCTVPGFPDLKYVSGPSCIGAPCSELHWLHLMSYWGVLSHTEDGSCDNSRGYMSNMDTCPTWFTLLECFA